MPKPRTDLDEIFEKVKPFAAREEGIGVKDRELVNIARSTFSQSLSLLVRIDKLFRMVFGMQTAYFLTWQHAEARKAQLYAQSKAKRMERVKAYNDARKLKPKPPRKARKPPELHQRMTISPRRMPSAKFSELPMVIPADVKITRSTHNQDMRYWVDPNTVGPLTAEWKVLRGQK